MSNGSKLVLKVSAIGFIIGSVVCIFENWKVWHVDPEGLAALTLGYAIPWAVVFALFALIFSIKKKKS